MNKSNYGANKKHLFPILCTRVASRGINKVIKVKHSNYFLTDPTDESNVFTR